jgi:hypothetical protein
MKLLKAIGLLIILIIIGLKVYQSDYMQAKREHTEYMAIIAGQMDSLDVFNKNMEAAIYIERHDRLSRIAVKTVLNMDRLAIGGSDPTESEK